MRRWTTNLRARITIAILAVTGTGCAFFGLGTYLSSEGLEDVVLKRQVRHELDTLQRLSADRPQQTVMESALLKAYAGIDNPALPPELAALAPGDYHSVPIDGRRYQILVAERDGRRYYISYDITEWENRERWMIAILVAGVLLVCAGAVWLGFWASRQIVAPITQLAARVTALQPDQRDVQIASEFEGVEVQDIARAFDRFMSRLDGLVAREQSFTSAASHELRTPLAVMQGAADVLQEQSGLNPTAERAIARIQRAGREMREFIDALLFLAREPGRLQSTQDSCDLGELVEELIADFRILYEHRNIELLFEAGNVLRLRVAPSLPAIVVSNLLRNAIENTEHGSVSVLLEGDALIIRDTGTGIRPDDQHRIFERSYSTKAEGRGMGLHIVDRICSQCGWILRFDSREGAGTTVTLRFPSDGTLLDAVPKTQNQPGPV